jgi:dihydrofolate synthase/folylpolyglutamate synthase
VDYNQAIQFLYTQYPAFERQGGLAYKPGLENVLGISAAFNNPHHRFKSIHIAGTNGKGSSASMLSAILQKAGYKVGLYTSPHIHAFTERIRVNGIEIPESEVVDFVTKNTSIFDTFKPSFFEITTILAFYWFAKQEVDIAIIETGMGGRLDATNIIHPEVALITNVSLDHTQFLGSTLQEIAGEKAGIIKLNTPIVISEFQEEIHTIYQHKAIQLLAPIIEAYNIFSIESIVNKDLSIEIKKNATQEIFSLNLDLKGDYQIKNCLGVLSVIDVLKSKGWHIASSSITEGFAQVQLLSGFKGRWQIIQNNPLVILDAAHNEAGMDLAMQQLRQLNKKIHIVIGMVKDKDISAILSFLPKNANYYFCQSSNPRAMDVTELQELAREQGLHGLSIVDVNAALDQAKKQSNNEDVIWVGGSLYVLGELALN